jgi:hypothetical protein
VGTASVLTATDDAASIPRGAAWDRLEDQIGWYNRRSATSKRSYMYIKVFQLVAGAAVPVAASVHSAVWVTGGLGSLVVVLEGLQQLGQFQANWLSYRSTAEALKHEKYLFLARAGPYHPVRQSDRLLAERIEGLISQEHAKWTAGRETVEREEAGAASQDHSGGG